jgi:hypothetical protein
MNDRLTAHPLLDYNRRRAAAMNGRQIKTALGAVAVLALLVLLVESELAMPGPITDRTLGVLAGLIWGLLNIDIGLRLTDVVRADDGDDTDQPDQPRRKEDD